MAVISQKTLSNEFWWKNFFISIRISVKFGPKGLNEPMMTQFTDTYMRH